MVSPSTLLAIALAMPTALYALGINCRGSAQCGMPYDAINKFISIAPGLDHNRQYHSGENIMCETRSGGAAGVCLFLDDVSGGVSTDEIRRLLDALRNHGCTKCGSVPIDFPGSNSPANGVLKSNYVGDMTNGGCRIVSTNEYTAGIC